VYYFAASIQCGQKGTVVSLTPSELQEIATLARVDLPSETMDELSATLNNILGFFEQLSDANTEGAEPMAHPLNMSQRLRTDEVTETNHRDEYQQRSASVEQGVYLVPKVIE